MSMESIFYLILTLKLKKMNIVFLFWMLLSLSLIGYFFNLRKTFDYKKSNKVLSKLKNR